jgi:ABC-type uncharacterized transport system fused permease/ATPase subunit
VANLVERQADRRLARRLRLLPSPVLPSAERNPDQRIQQDIYIFTTGVGGQTNNPAYGSSNTLLFGAAAAVLSVIAFGAIL